MPPPGKAEPPAAVRLPPRLQRFPAHIGRGKLRFSIAPSRSRTAPRPCRRPGRWPGRRGGCSAPPAPPPATRCGREFGQLLILFEAQLDHRALGLGHGRSRRGARAQGPWARPPPRAPGPLAQPVVVAADVFLATPPPVQHQHAGDQVVQEGPVVADQQQRAGDSPAAGLPASPASRYPGRWWARPAPAGWPGGAAGAPAAAGCAPRPAGR